MNELLLGVADAGEIVQEVVKNVVFHGIDVACGSYVCIDNRIGTSRQVKTIQGVSLNPSQENVGPGASVLVEVAALVVIVVRCGRAAVLVICVREVVGSVELELDEVAGISMMTVPGLVPRGGTVVVIGSEIGDVPV